MIRLVSHPCSIFKASTATSSGATRNLYGCRNLGEEVVDAPASVESSDSLAAPCND